MAVDWRQLDRTLRQRLPAPRLQKSIGHGQKRRYKHQAEGQAERDELAELPLGEFIRRVSPELAAPDHLGPLVTELETMIAPHEGQRIFWFSVPPRHYKTTTLRHAALQHLIRWPDDGVAFLSHTGSFANKQSRDIKRAAQALKMKLSVESKRQSEWELQGHEGGLVARGVGGDITGRGFRLIILDDPVKSREKANSAIERERLWEWISDDVLTRLDPDGSLVMVHTRWVDDDPIGRAIEHGWPGKNIPALGGEEENEPLLPDVWGFKYLDGIRQANPWKFASLYQGAPRPKEAALFQEPTFYTELPKQYRVGYGIDLAYTESTRADFSVVIKGFYADGKLYVVDLIRSQCHAPAFADILTREFNAQPAPMIWIASGTEKGAAQFIRQKVPKLRIKVASTDKYTRATPVAEAWNQGRVLVPDLQHFPKGTWVPEFVREVTRFSGHHDVNDDQVDALAALWRVFQASPMVAAMKSLSTQGF